MKQSILKVGMRTSWYFVIYDCDELVFIFFFFNDTATTEIYTLSLHDALPISSRHFGVYLSIHRFGAAFGARITSRKEDWNLQRPRSEEHTSELQSPCNLVCRLLLEKKKKKKPQCQYIRLMFIISYRIYYIK